MKSARRWTCYGSDSREPNDPEEIMGRFDRGRIFIMINRGDRWQCGVVIAKGSLEQIHRRGLEAFRNTVAMLAPFLGNRTGELKEWDDIKLLTVRVDRLPRWHRPGLLCIGDAAHAMSPVGGVGINLAIQDAVAAANLLAEPILQNRLKEDHLHQVQRRRERAARVTQWMQVQVQNRVITRVLGTGGNDHRAADTSPIRALSLSATDTCPVDRHGLAARACNGIRTASAPALTETRAAAALCRQKMR